MRQTIRFGRAFGIEVGADWSLLVLVPLVAGGLAAVGLPGRASGYSATAYWMTGAVCGVLVAGSLLDPAAESVRFRGIRPAPDCLIHIGKCAGQVIRVCSRVRAHNIELIVMRIGVQRARIVFDGALPIA